MSTASDFSPPYRSMIGVDRMADPVDSAMRREGDPGHPPCSLRTALERGIRPAVGFHNPDDVVKDPHLTVHDKREILASWASDASAVQDEPRMRWLLGTVEPVPLDDVRAALKRLDVMEGAPDEWGTPDLSWRPHRRGSDGEPGAGPNAHH